MNELCADVPFLSACHGLLTASSRPFRAFQRLGAEKVAAQACFAACKQDWHIFQNIPRIIGGLSMKVAAPKGGHDMRQASSRDRR